MVAIDTLRRITLEARAVGVSEASAALGRLLSSNEAVLASIEKLDATDKKRRESLIASARQFDNTVAANDKAYGAAMRYAATVEKLERLLKSGSGSQEAYNVAMAAARAKFEDATQAAAGNAAATSRLAEEARALKAVLDPLGAAQDALSAKLKRYGEMALAGAIDEGELIEASLRAQLAFDEQRAAIDGTAEARRNLARENERLEATYLPLIKLEKDLAREQAAIAASSFSDAQKQTALSALEARMQLQREAIQRREATLSGVNDPNRRTRIDWSNLSFQLNDIGTMGLMGFSPMQIATSQGGQILQILQQAEGGPRAALKQIGQDALAAAGYVGRLAIAFPGVTAGIVGATAAGVFLWRQYSKEVPDADAILKRHAENIRDLKAAYGDAAAGLDSYTRKSRGEQIYETKRVGEDLARLDKYQAAQLVDALTISRVNDRSGNSRINAVQEVRPEFSALSGPIMGLVEDYNRGSVSAKRFQDEIRALAGAKGVDKDAAIALAAKLRETQDQFSQNAAAARLFDRSLRAISDSASELSRTLVAMDKFDRGPEKTARDQIDEIYRRGVSGATSGDEVRSLTKARSDALAELDRQLALTAASDALGIRSLTARTAAEKAAIAEEQKRVEIRRKWGEAGLSTPEARQAITAAGQMVLAQSAAQVAAMLDQSAQSSAEITRASQLQAETWGKSAGEVARLTERSRLYAEYARQGVAVTTELAGQIERAADASGRAADEADRANRARQAPLAARGDALALQSIYARSAEERAKIAEQQIMLEEARAGRPTQTPEVAARIKASRDQIYAQANVAARDALEQARLGAAAAGGRGLAGEVAQINAKYDALIRGAKGAADAVRDYNSARQIEIDMATRAAYANPLEQSDQQTREQIAATRLQAASFGQSAEQVAYLAEKTKLENEYARSGITLSRDLADAIEARARAAGRAAGETDRLTKAQQDAQRGLDEFRGTASSAIEAIFRGDKGGIADAFESYGRNILVRTASEGLFGKEGEAGGGMFGGLLGSAFGVTGKRGESAQNPLYVQPVNGSLGVPGVPGTGSPYMGGLSGLPGMGGASALTATSGGLNPVFDASLQRMISDAKAAGLDIGITSGFRSVDRQKQLWDAALLKYGSEEAARKWVAPPGRSNHNRGLAADLSYGPGAEAWAHENASRYGLAFPLSNEDWHVEPLGARSGQAAIAGMAGSGAGYGAAGPLNLAGGAGLQVDQTIGSLNTSLSSLTDGVGQIANQFVPGFGSVLSTLLNGMSAVSGGGGGFNLFSGLGSLFGGGSAAAGIPALGSIYANGGVPPGGLGPYRNTVVSRPTTFAFANGVGLMGEAGPEAIMPLKRDGAGRLGVSALGRPGSYDMAREARVSREERESTNHAKIEIAPTKDFEARIVSSATKESRRYTNNAVGQMGRELSKATPGRVESYQKLGS